ncbi:hypothetical protein S58_31840 [Bradyrhizobium oligotrophicum S58]|uniref:Uncharacterized protein n=1 Tax=Bradyrhizobium oligotrophicum S58 TaxID=1245469 RepID=M4Z7D5_9BRAD|nr:hypothetical protein S58_31840 [Bradyrhizobium oligotrophicum S58]
MLPSSPRRPRIDLRHRDMTAEARLAPGFFVDCIRVGSQWPRSEAAGRYLATRNFDNAVPIELKVVTIWLELVSM